MRRRRLLTTGVLAAAAGASLGALALAESGSGNRDPGGGERTAREPRERDAREPREPSARESRQPASRVLALRPLVPAGARTVRDPARAVRVRLPPGWRTFGGNLTPLLAPSYPGILIASTFDPGARPRRGCGSAPNLPRTPIGPRDALLHVSEELNAIPATCRAARGASS